MTTDPGAAPDGDAGPDLAADRRARYEAVFTSVYEPLQRYVRRRCPAASADDVVAKALLVVWQRLDDVPPDAAVAWTYGVARRCLANERRGTRRHLALVDRLRTSQARPPLATAAPATDPAAGDGSDLDGDLHAALARLGADDREVVRLWAWEQLAPREIATVLGISPNAASIRLHRAKAKLAGHLRGRKTATAVGHNEVGRTEEAT